MEKFYVSRRIGEYRFRIVNEISLLYPLANTTARWWGRSSRTLVQTNKETISDSTNPIEKEMKKIKEKQEEEKEEKEKEKEWESKFWERERERERECVCGRYKS
jgi:hypothetical protein